ncbi:MAG: hypothetical protein ACREBS_04335, partial [Nitrososphaerales archaeon]
MTVKRWLYSPYHADLNKWYRIQDPTGFSQKGDKPPRNRESIINMTFLDVESSLAEATKYLNAVVTRREKLIKESREVIALSAKAIIGIHSSEFAEAKRLRKQAREKLDEMRRVAGTDLAKYLVTPEQEYVESSVTFAIRTGSSIPSRKQLGVSQSSYILGLLDAVGEMKRSVYDNIRKSEFGTAERTFA